MIRRFLAAGATVLALATSACGGSGDAAAPVPSPTQPPGSSASAAGSAAPTTVAAPSELSGARRIPPPQVDSLTLPDASAGGAPFTFRAEPDGVLVVYFGYTSCPDVCPTTMADLRVAIGDLDPTEQERVSVAMATVDPGRDSDEKIAAYVDSFVAGSHGLRTTEPDELRAVADLFGASYQFFMAADNGVDIVHTGFLYAVDDAGRLVLTWPFGTNATDLGNDLHLLLNGAAA